MSDIKREFKYVITPDGYRIATWLSITTNTRAIVVLCHGITVDSTEGGLFNKFENILLSNNIGTIRFDFRCHGKSTGDPKDLTLYGEYLDLRSILNYENRRWSLPFVLLATSFSCSAVMRNIFEGNVSYKGVILWNPVINYQKTFLEPSTPWVKSILETRRDPSLPSWTYASIPGTKYFITKKLAREFKTDKTYIILKKLKLSSIGFHGNKDTKVPFRFLKEIAQRNENIEFHLLEGEGHGFKKKRGYVIEKTIMWIKEVIAE